jgi:putative transposase
MYVQVENTVSASSNLIDFNHRPKYIFVMNILQAFKFQLKISGAQRRKLYRIAGSCRFVFNKALALQQKHYELVGKKLSYANLCKELTKWRADPSLLWLKASPSQALQQSLKDLERAYQNFFAKRADFPRFKRRRAHDAFRFPQGVKLDQANSRVYLPKLGWVSYRNSRVVVGEISNITISRSCDKWYVSIQTEANVPEPIHKAMTSVGMDVGIIRFATLSDGTVFEPVNSFKKYQKRLAAYQRRFSKQKRYGKNWKKTNKKISKLHQKISNVRQDYLHQTSNIISKNHAMVCLEDLQIKNMSASAKGTLESPGRQVKAKSGLNKAILDQGWYELRRQLEYKQKWRGGVVIFVSPRNTSRTCPNCGYIASENRRSQSHFVCVECQYENNADLVGAINILRAGHAQLTCGEMAQLGCSMNQEPSEVARALT